MQFFLSFHWVHANKYLPTGKLLELTFFYFGVRFFRALFWRKQKLFSLEIYVLIRPPQQYDHFFLPTPYKLDALHLFFCNCLSENLKQAHHECLFH